MLPNLILYHVRLISDQKLAPLFTPNNSLLHHFFLLTPDSSLVIYNCLSGFDITPIAGKMPAIQIFNC